MFDRGARERDTAPDGPTARLESLNLPEPVPQQGPDLFA